MVKSSYIKIIPFFFKFDVTKCSQLKIKITTVLFYGHLLAPSPQMSLPGILRSSSPLLPLLGGLVDITAEETIRKS